MSKEDHRDHPPKFHLREQRADALLQPLLATVRELERQTQHYLDRLKLGAEDGRAIRDAHGTLGAARAELERLRRDRTGRSLPTSTGEERE